MSADLQHINTMALGTPARVRFSSLSKTIVALYVLTFLTVSIGTGFALYQNWLVRVDLANARLLRSAHMGNFLIETALNSAAKSLDSTQQLFSEVLQMGPMAPTLAAQLLQDSYAKFQTYNKTDVFGLMLFVDPQGRLVAQSEGAADPQLDFSDRLYFHQLRHNHGLKRTVGPLVMAQTTGQWVFHMSVPVVGQNGEFAGVLVQQILENDIAQKLARYVDTAQFEQLITHFDGSEPSFVFPSPGHRDATSPDFLQTLTQKRGPDERAAQPSKALLVGFVKSEVYDLGTYATFPQSRLRAEFAAANRYLLLYAVVGIIFTTVMFLYLYRLAQRLSTAQRQSAHDPLTGLHNRRALDDALPCALRAAKRSQKPISVLFIDIDHFRYFNEHYGHESGDVALQAVAQALQSCARRPMDFVCRWGGEEFVVVLPDTPRLAAMKVADDMLTAVRQIELQSLNGAQPHLTISIGHVSQVLSVQGPPEDLVDQADKAMLQAKLLGRNRRAEYRVILAPTSAPTSAITTTAPRVTTLLKRPSVVSKAPAAGRLGADPPSGQPTG